MELELISYKIGGKSTSISRTFAMLGFLEGLGDINVRQVVG